MGSSGINLDGAEISVIKAMGLSGGGISGQQLVARVPHLEIAEVIDLLKTLIALGYVDSDKLSFRTNEDFNNTVFNVNSGYAKELRDVLNPPPVEKKSKRVRRE